MEAGEVECEVGGVHHVLYRCSTSHPHQALRKRVLDRGGCRDGRVLPYLAHYLATGDVLYPEHEGEVMVGRLLQEATRLDLVNHLLHPTTSNTTPLTSCIPRPHAHNTSDHRGGVRVGGGEGVGTLKVHTRRRPRLSLPAIITNLLPPHPHTPAHPPPVYRPPPNKGTTVVVVSRRGEAGGNNGVEVYATPGVLPSLIPAHTQDHTQTHTQDHAQTHTQAQSHSHSLSSHVRLSMPPHQFLSTLADKGYFPTVRSWWVCEVTGAVVTQWLVYRRGRRRGRSATKPSLSSTASAALSLSSTALSFSSTLRRASSTSHLSFISHLSSSSSHLSSASASSSSRADSEGGKEGSEEDKETLLEDRKTREGGGQERGRERFKNRVGVGGERKASDKGAGREGEGEEGAGGERRNGGEREGESEVRLGGGTLKNRLKTRSKSIISLATDHSTRPALTLKRLLNALL